MAERGDRALRRAAAPGAEDRRGRPDRRGPDRRLPRLHAPQGRQLGHLLHRPLHPPARVPDLAAPRAAGTRARQGGRSRPDRRRQPPQLPRPLRDRRIAALAAAAPLRRQGRALRDALAGVDPQPARRLPGAPRRGRPRDGPDLERDPRARRRRLHLPGGHADPPRLARRSPPRRRPPRARDRGRRDAGRGARLRARPRRLEDPPAQGPPPRRQGSHLPADREPLALARRHRHLADLAERRAAVGVARRAAADAQGGRDRRRQLGNRDGRPARARRRRGPARNPHRRAGRGDRQGARELLPARHRPLRPDHGQARGRHRGRRPRPRLPRRPVGEPSGGRRLPGRPHRPRTAILLLSKGLSRRSARSPASTSTSASAPARSPRSAAPRTPRRRPPGPPRWHSRAATRTCAPSSATSSTAPG